MGQIKVTSCPIEGLYVIEPTVHGDARGWFMEVFNQNDLREAGIDRDFVQENESCSEKGVLRGLHFQKQFPQAKLARVLRGAVFDVAVDLRKNSATYGQWHGEVLSEENRKMFFVPEGFAHGLLSLTEGAIFCYKCTDFYHPGDEGGILWNDPEVGIRWPEIDMEYLGVTDFGSLRMADGMPIKLSEKDKGWLPLRDTFSF